jgi:type II secretion system protein N
MPAAPAAGPRLPRGLLWVGVPLAGLALIVFFVFLRFPFERFRDALAFQAGRALGAQVSIGGLDGAFGLAGPGFVARDVVVAWPDGARAAVARAAVRPAWSLAWLGGSPALHVAADADLGRVAGAVILGDEPGVDGRLSGVALARLPLARFTGGASLEGALDLDADLRMGATGPVGDARFEARDGSFAAPNLPIAIPYEKLSGELRFGEDGSLAFEEVSLEGPMVSGTLSGGTGPGPSPWAAPLDAALHLEARDRNLHPTLRSAGVPLRPDGSVDLKLGGSLSAPVIR